MSKPLLIIIVFIIFAIAGVYYLKNSSGLDSRLSTSLKVMDLRGNDMINGNDENKNGESKEDLSAVEVVLENLEIPWDLVFLPNGQAIFTERAGRVRVINKDGVLQDKPIFNFADVKATGEGGLLGVTLDPDFSSNNYIYFYYTYSQTGNNTLNKVVRFKLASNQLTVNPSFNTLSDQKVLLDKIPGALFHNGGRIKFGPDNYLYITTGDAQEPSLAQKMDTLAGKILRLDRDGNVPKDNPFNNPVYSYGHRNPQGLVWDDKGRLWETEHGQSARDELNLIEKGKNYGWPIITGAESAPGMVTPVLQSGSGTWAPSGMTIYNNKIYFAGLRGVSLFEVSNYDSNPQIKKYFENKYGRLRTVNLKDNMFYILTNNKDGRGLANPGDDKIIRINPEKLN